MSILDELAAHARERVLADSENMSLDILQAMCREKGRANGARFYDALKKDDLSFICEVKKASPSKGVIARDFLYLDIARDYEAAGADCISCLTEPKWFLGSDDIFREIRAAVSTPMLRKDFTVSDYQLYQSRLMGADCVLLICALLDTKTLAQYLAVCDELGLSALVETHDADEIRSAVAAGAKIIGVNNRNLKDFSVDFSNAARLRDRIPPEAVYVAESGVQSTQDVAALRSIGADAVLIGWPETDASDVITPDAAQLDDIDEQMRVMEQHIAKFSAMERDHDIVGMTDTLIRVTERVAGIRSIYQPDFPLPTFAEIRRVVQDEWDEDMDKIDPDNASPTADSIEQETADADKEQQAEKQAEQQADGAQKSGASA